VSINFSLDYVSLRLNGNKLENERDALKAKRHNLDLPALKHDFLDQILNNLEKVVGAVPPGQKKHLLHLLVKKVLVRDRRTAEIWYRLPQESPVRTLSDLVASMGQYANLVRRHGPEVIFSAASVYRVIPQRDILIQPKDVLVMAH